MSRVVIKTAVHIRRVCVGGHVLHGVAPGMPVRFKNQVTQARESSSLDMERWVRLDPTSWATTYSGGIISWSSVGDVRAATRFTEEDAAAWILAHSDDPSLLHPDIVVTAEPA